MFRYFALALISGLLILGFIWSGQLQSIAAGIAIFLFGILSMDDGFRVFTGGSLKRWLGLMTDRLWKGIVFGAGSTALVQSSSLVSVVAISFLSAGLMDLRQGVGFIFGANLGTTSGAWFIALFGLKVDISSWSMPMLVLGILFVMQRTRALKGFGQILAGVGFLFLGIHYMKSGFTDLQQQLDLAAWSISGFKGLVVYSAIGIVATVLMQSSHATLILTITALSLSQITFDNAVALAIGANVGTTITAMIGALGANASGRQLAGAHFVFNGVTAVLAVLAFPFFMTLVDGAALLLDLAEDAYTLRLALFHSIFNLAGIVVMLPFVSPLMKGVQRVFPDRRHLPRPPTVETEAPAKVARHRAVLVHPDTALEAIINETRYLWEATLKVIEQGLYLIDRDGHRITDLESGVPNRPTLDEHLDLDELYAKEVKPLYNEVLQLSSRIQGELSEQQQQMLFELKLATRDLINAFKDVKHLQKNLKRYAITEEPVIARQYNEFRVQLGRLIQALRSLLSVPDPEEAMLRLSELQVNLSRNDIVTNGQLDKEIIDHEIPAEVVGSMVNDSRYTLDIGHNLVQMASQLYFATSSDDYNVHRELSLTRDEADLYAQTNRESDDVPDKENP